jgi:hypothetical protein
MLRRWHLISAALLAMAAFYAASIQAADLTPRQALMGRQQIRAELAAAMNNGKISRMDQYKILLHAKEVLTPEDLRGLERTLDRLATQSEKSRRATRGVYDAAPASGGDNDSAPGRARNVNYQTDAEARTAVSTAPLAASTLPAAPAPNAEPGNLSYEVPETIPAPTEEGGPQPDGAAPDAPPPYMDQSCDFGDGEGRVFGGGETFGEGLESCCRRSLLSLSAFTTIDSFKGPQDLNDINGNYGTRFGVLADFLVSRRMGIAVEAGTSGVISDFKGTVFTGSNVRQQEFTTVGFYQRLTNGCRAFKYGFVHDWDQDRYYARTHFAQWRVKAAEELSPHNEIGVWAAIPDHGATADVTLPDGTFIEEDQFKPITQGSLYWRHLWANAATTSVNFGLAENPGEFVFGADARLPLSQKIALISGFTYVLPRDPGMDGQANEMWNISVGIEIVPGGHNCCGTLAGPLFPVADNGSFILRRLTRNAVAQ